MRRGGRPSSQQQQHSHSRSNSQDSNSFFHPSQHDNQQQTQQQQAGRQPSLPIPHSSEDLDRLRLEHQLGSLSMMSSSHASSSAAARSDDGSSVEMGRGYDGRNLSAGGREGSTLAGGSFSTGRGGGASPVSTAGHHVSAVTLRAGLVGGAGGGRRAGGGGGDEFDEERELARMLDGRGGVSFGLGDMGLLGDTPPGKQHHLNSSSHRRVTESDFRGTAKGAGRASHTVNNENQPPSSRHHNHHPSPLRPKLADRLTHSFSPKRPSSIASPPPTNHARRPSTFETLARGLEEQIRSGGGVRSAMGELSLNGEGGGGVRRNPSGGRRKGGRGANSSMMSSGGQRDGQGRLRLVLPGDVTGVMSANDTPGRAGRRDLGDGGNGEEEADAHPLSSLATLSARLTLLESKNAHSQKHIVELELELQTTRERERAAKEEWKLEREYLRKEQVQMSAGDGEWEKRYWQVVEEKKALEALVASLRAQLARLTADLISQRTLITQLQNQRTLDAAEISRRGEEVERLRQEVAKLATEVGGLRRAVEGREAGRREAQTSPLLPQELVGGVGLGSGFERGEERRDERGAGASADDLARLQTDAERRQASRTSPIERPASRLSDGLRAAAGSLDRSPPLSHDRLIPSTAARPSDPPQPFSPSHRSKPTTDHLLPPLPPSPYDSGPASPINGWARSFTSQEEIIDIDEQDRTVRPRASKSVVEEEESLIKFDDDEEVVTPKAKPSSSEKKVTSASAKKTGAPMERLPPQTVLARVLRQLEDDYANYKSIYIELSDAYKLMNSTSNTAKRTVLAEHLKEVIDTLEQKASQITSLYSLLTFADRPLPPSAASADMTSKAFKSVKELLRSTGERERRKREGVV